MHLLGGGSLPVEQRDRDFLASERQQPPEFPGGGVADVEHGDVAQVAHQSVRRPDRQREVRRGTPAGNQGAAIPGYEIVALSRLVLDGA